MSRSEPFPKHLKPMLARMAPLPADEDWGFEIKWDGVRGIGYANRGECRLESRGGEEVTKRYPELAALAESVPGRALVLDGELVALDADGKPSFQLIQRRMGLTSAGAIKQRMVETPVVFMVFDLIHLDGASTRELPYEERRRLVDGLELEGPSWQAPRNHPGPGADLLEAARDQGLEGVVAKRLDSPYRPGKRTGEWIKARVWRRQEFVIGGWIAGEPQRLHFAGAVGSGLKEEDIDFLTRELKKRRRDTSPFDVGAPRGTKVKLALFCEPELVCEVSWTEWTNAGTLRQPAFKGMRDDKDPRDAVRES